MLKLYKNFMLLSFKGLWEVWQWTMSCETEPRPSWMRSGNLYLLP